MKIVLLLIALSVIACEPSYLHDAKGEYYLQQTCLKSHQELRPQAKGILWTITVCDSSRTDTVRVTKLK